MIDRFKYVIRSIAAGFWFSFALGWNFAVFTSSLRNYRFPIIMMIVIIGGVLPPYLIYNRKLLMGLVGLALSLVAFYFSESYLSPLCDYGRFDYRDYSEADGKGIFIVLGMPFLLLIGLQILVLLICCYNITNGYYKSCIILTIIPLQQGENALLAVFIPAHFYFYASPVSSDGFSPSHASCTAH